jgi:PKD repeat protein
VTPASGTVNLEVAADASGSSDGDATPIAGYRFDFGDGSAPVGPQAAATAAHTYTAAGAYTVRVTVTDTAGQSSVATRTVTVTDSPPSAALTVAPATGEAPLAVTADASGSSDNDGTPIATYTFDFGDGSAPTGPQAAPTASHTYPTAGSYTAKVTVKDTAGLASTATQPVTVTTPAGDAPPRAALTVTPGTGSAPLGVTADASASTDSDNTPIATYRFDFGDGTAAVGPQAAARADHTYTAAGTYRATVTVTDTAGLTGTASQTVSVSATDAPPSAALAITPSSGGAPLAVSADASGSRDDDATPIASYRFDFGDGTTAVGPQAAALANHTYTAAGVYTATVTVTDTAGLTAQATAQVTVSATANLVGNPGFEVDTSGWNTSSASDPSIVLTRVAGGHTGGWSARLQNTGSTSTTCLLNDSPNWVTTTVAGTYTATLWTRADLAGATLKLRIREYKSGTLVGTATMLQTLSTAWQPVTVSYVPVNPGTSTLDLNAYVSSAAPGTCFYADDVSIGHGN